MFTLAKRRRCPCPPSFSAFFSEKQKWSSCQCCLRLGFLSCVVSPCLHLCRLSPHPVATHPSRRRVSFSLVTFWFESRCTTYRLTALPAVPGFEVFIHRSSCKPRGAWWCVDAAPPHNKPAECIEIKEIGEMQNIGLVPRVTSAKAVLLVF